MAKASRQRRLKQERDRQRQRAARNPGAAGSRRPQPAPGAAPSQRELVSLAIVEALDAMRQGQQDAYGEYLDVLAIERAPGWTQAVSRGLVEYLKAGGHQRLAARLAAGRAGPAPRPRADPGPRDDGLAT